MQGLSPHATNCLFQTHKYLHSPPEHGWRPWLGGTQHRAIHTLQAVTFQRRDQVGRRHTTQAEDQRVNHNETILRQRQLAMVGTRAQPEIEKSRFLGCQGLGREPLPRSRRSSQDGHWDTVCVDVAKGRRPAAGPRQMFRSRHIGSPWLASVVLRRVTVTLGTQPGGADNTRANIRAPTLRYHPHRSLALWRICTKPQRLPSWHSPRPS
jgi:hypothetical protein